MNYGCYGLDSLSKTHVEARMPIVTVSGDEAFKETISVSGGRKGQALIQQKEEENRRPHTEETVRIQPEGSQGERLHQKSAALPLDFQLPGL